MYERGEGVRQDAAEALRLYTLAAEQGAATAQVNVGIMRMQGFDVEQDDNEAVKWFGRAADQGHAQAIQMQAHMFSAMFTPGAAVQIAGLMGRPELNDHRGVVSAGPGATGRVQVRLASRDRDIAVRPQNLRLTKVRAPSSGLSCCPMRPSGQ